MFYRSTRVAPDKQPVISKEEETDPASPDTTDTGPSTPEAAPEAAPEGAPEAEAIPSESNA